jgi:hypothetical protein
MRCSTRLAAAALLCLASTGASAAAHRPDLVLAQAGVTGGAGSNSPAAMPGPHTGGAPGSLDGGADAKRTSKDSGTSNPLAGDEQDGRRPSADTRPAGSAPQASPGVR